MISVNASIDSVTSYANRCSNVLGFILSSNCDIIAMLYPFFNIIGR
jgi:hypothetical protein